MYFLFKTGNSVNYSNEFRKLFWSHYVGNRM